MICMSRILQNCVQYLILGDQNQPYRFMQKGKPYILFAEDDPDDQLIFCEAFARLDPGSSIIVVNDGKNLFEFLDTCQYDELPALILVDYKMPVVSGPEVLRRLASRPVWRAIPTLVWSTSERAKEKDECIGLGAVGYFQKPSTAEETDDLVRRINQIFEDKGANISELK